MTPGVGVGVGVPAGVGLPVGVGDGDVLSTTRRGEITQPEKTAMSNSASKTGCREFLFNPEGRDTFTFQRMLSREVLLAHYFGFGGGALRRTLDLRSSQEDVKMQYAQKYSISLDTRTLPGRCRSSSGSGDVRAQEAGRNGSRPQSQPVTHAESEPFTIALAFAGREYVALQDAQGTHQLCARYEPGHQHLS